MTLRKNAAYVVIGLGALTALYGIYLAFSPMLLQSEHTSPLGAAASDATVRDLLTFASFQIAMLTIAWGAFVAGLATPAIERNDASAQLSLWIGGVAVSLATLLRMAAIGDWAGVAFSAVPTVGLAVALLVPYVDARQPRRLTVKEPAQTQTQREREEPPRAM